MSLYNDDFANFDVKMSNEEARENILALISCYKDTKEEERQYRESDLIPENIIYLYVAFINKNGKDKIFKKFKKAYIENESLVEPGVSKNEKLGIGAMYDYIANFDFEKKPVNVYMELFKLHMLLYSKCPHPEYGGILRNGQALLANVEYEVPEAEKARLMFQEYIKENLEVKDDDLFKYINKLVQTSVDLTAIQPFPDGNKRSARSLLNLGLAKIGIPPVYIEQTERKIYKDALIEAITKKDYTYITRFYYYKICDAIVDLDLSKNFIEKEDKTKKIAH